MGHQRNHAIVVSGYGEYVDEAREAALRIFGDDPEHGWTGRNVTPIADGPSNGERSFLVGPDGSNEGWPTSNEGDERRARFVEWLRRRSEEPGYDRVFLVDWVEVTFGDDHFDVAEVTAQGNDGVHVNEDW